MLATQLAVPRIRVEAATRAVVTRWGEVHGLVLRPGDRLVLGGRQDGLVLLVPRGYGHPMLGRVTPRGLVAEPGGVPASPARWTVAGGVHALERALERGAGLPDGRWFTCVRASGPIDGLSLADLEPQKRSVDEVEALVRRALLASRDSGHQVHIGIARDQDAAALLAETATEGHARIALTPVMSAQVAPVLAPAGRVIAGPWGPRPARRQAVQAVEEPRRQLGLFDFARRSG